MGTHLGGFKNMLKRWRINLKMFKKKHSKLVGFGYKLIAIVIIPFGYFFDNFNPLKNKKNLSKLNKTKNNNIRKQELTKKERINGKKIEKESNKNIEIVDKSQINSNVIGTMGNLRQLIFKLADKQLEKSKEKNGNNASKSIKKQSTSDVSFKTSKSDLDAVKKVKVDLDTIKQQSVNNVLSDKSNGDLETVKLTKEVLDKSVVVLSPILLKKIIESKNIDAKITNIKQAVKANKKIDVKIYNSTIELINDKIKNLLNLLNNNEDYKYLTYIENEFKYLLKQTERLRESYNINELIDLGNKDKYELLKSPEKIDNLVKNIKNEIKKIEDKKVEIFNKKEKTEKKEEKIAQKKNEKKEKKQEIVEIVVSNKIIYKQIKEQQELLDKYIYAMKNSYNKKNTLLGGLKYFANSIIHSNLFWFSMIFKNPVLDYLLQAILINNSLKTMHYMVQPKYKFDYEKFNANYINAFNAMNKIEFLCNDSLRQINFIKQQIEIYGIDDIELISKLDLIENELLRQSKIIKNDRENIKSTKNKIKKLTLYK